jgi:hypothetical protein
MDAHDELLRAAVDIARAASGRRSLIAARFPGDGVTGEELGDARRKISAQTARGRRANALLIAALPIANNCKIANRKQLQFA